MKAYTFYRKQDYLLGSLYDLGIDTHKARKELEKIGRLDPELNLLTESNIKYVKNYERYTWQFMSKLETIRDFCDAAVTTETNDIRKIIREAKLCRRQVTTVLNDWYKLYNESYSYGYHDSWGSFY